MRFVTFACGIFYVGYSHGSRRHSSLSAFGYSRGDIFHGVRGDQGTHRPWTNTKGPKRTLQKYITDNLADLGVAVNNPCVKIWRYSKTLHDKTDFHIAPIANLGHLAWKKYLLYFSYDYGLVAVVQRNWWSQRSDFKISLFTWNPIWTVVLISSSVTSHNSITLPFIRYLGARRVLQKKVGHMQTSGKCQPLSIILVCRQLPLLCCIRSILVRCCI